MSSLRNAIERRNHKERAQPQIRQKLGILEKHKDYALRSKDFNSKKVHLKRLRQKASQRNPDEFHFGMIKGQTDAIGRKIKHRSSESISNAAAHLLKTQDVGYLRSIISKSKADVEHIKQSIAVDDALCSTMASKGLGQEDLGRSNRRLVYIGNEQEQHGLSSGFWGVDRRINNDMDSQKDPPGYPTIGAEKRKRRLQEARLNKLQFLKTRQAELESGHDKINLERAKMSNTAGTMRRNGRPSNLRERKR